MTSPFNWRGQPSTIGRDKTMRGSPNTGMTNSQTASFAAETYRKRTGQSLCALGDLSAKGDTNPHATRTGVK